MRNSFLEYFQKHDHRLVPSSPVIPHNDPTLLFTNAGMNQFKDVFTGQRKVPYNRATSSQKCIRAGGKHNDLDNVGFTARHNTFFEMLGNFSFGDYFKEEAIVFAWEWITKELKLPKDKLYASVYEEDDDAFNLWGKIAPELKNGRILRFGKKDNYWSMGDTGPNGPCSEIHIDRGESYGTGPDDVVNGETQRFVEFWNLVFMQYETLPDGRTIELPKPSVDTGAGLERIASLLQDTKTNFGIDLFQNIMAAISDITNIKYKDKESSFNVIADHLRALTFAIADGAGISNVGQGYVLRRILRRAVRHGRLLNMKEPFLYRLVPSLVYEMGEAFPEIKEKQSHIENVIKAEEETFVRTLDNGLDLFNKIAEKLKSSGSKVIDGNDVFKLYDTYGFPYDLTEIMAAEMGYSLDLAGFEKAMETQKAQSKASGKTNEYQNQDIKKITDELTELGIENQPVTHFVRDDHNIEANILLSYYDASNGTIAILLDKSTFYVESGGQIGDIGKIVGNNFTVEVNTVINHLDRYIHIGTIVEGTYDDIIRNLNVSTIVDVDRRWHIRRNHTATHLAHKALRIVLGDHVKQSGSYVGPDRLRFDFSHHQPMTPDEIREVEEIVNNEILKGHEVTTDIMNVDEAKMTGAMALFGEKYGDKVRVVSVDKFSKELCGGTHVDNVSQIGPFFITLETGIASGVRRLEAITGEAAIKYMLDAKYFRREVAETIGRSEADALLAVGKLTEDNKSLQKEIKKIKSQMLSGGSASIGDEKEVEFFKIYFNDFGETDKDIMAGWIDNIKSRQDSALAIGLGTIEGKWTVMTAASSSAIKDHKAHAGNLLKDTLKEFNGRGGGKPNFAQGSVETGTAFNAIVDTFIKHIRKISGNE
ncbi:MAG: alanine--tRNA ligase [bacterium]